MAAESTAAAATTGPQVSDELQRVRDGKLSPDEYLDLQVERAVSHLRDRVSSRRLEVVKGVLREQLATSPVLAELLQRMGVSVPATGVDGA